MLSLCSAFLNIGNIVIITSPGRWPWTSAALAYLDSQLHLLNSGRSLGPVQSSLPCAVWPGNSPDSKLGASLGLTMFVSPLPGTVHSCTAWCLMTEKCYLSFLLVVSSWMVYLFHLSWQWKSKMYLESVYLIMPAAFTIILPLLAWEILSGLPGLLPTSLVPFST